MSRSPVMPRSLASTLLVAAALATGLTTEASAQKVMKEVSPKRMGEILSDMKIEHRPLNDEKDAPLVLEMNGYRALLFILNDDTDGQLYTVFTDVDVSTDRMNEWNRDHRFARAYRDRDGDAVIEADLDFAGGVSEGAIRAWIELFDDIATDYAAALD